MTKTDSPLSYEIDKDIMISDDGTLFFIGGNHSVIRYVLRQIKPTEESIQNFYDNVASRSDYCKKRDIKYLHIVFPDKQSALVEDFPLKDIRCLGEYYLKQGLGPVDDILYPIDCLRANARQSFLKLDTHMSDFGSALVLEEILKRIQLHDSEAIASLKANIKVERVLSGDLGGRFDPPRTHKAVCLQLPWKIKHLLSAKQFNDGLVDIFFNPNAVYDKTLVLFGDSFFRMMIKHFSCMFSKVICFRTRFFHSELVELISPDVVLTGNVERYLSNVESDREGFPFFFYGYKRPETLPKEEDFLQAYQALLSPKAVASKDYFAAVSQELEVLNAPS